jgi:electron transfer flavoprotein beta subunit
MKILVCVSSVPDTTTKIKFIDQDTKFNSEGVQFIINPYDEFGLTKALQLREAAGGSVTILHVGTASNDPIIRKALAIGADDAVRIDTEPIDGMHVANEIANYAKDKEYDLIITGRESIDYNGGMVPHLIAELLNIPSVSPCVGLSINETEAELDTYIDGGKESLKAALPVVIGSQKGLVEESELRIPNMRGIMMSRSKPLVVEKSTSNEHGQRTVNHELPPVKAGCTIIDSAEVDKLVELLQNEAKVI